MNSIDRFIFRALYQKMASEWEKQFSQYSYAYQNNKGVLTAVEQAAKYMEEGKDRSVELDIQNFLIILIIRLLFKIKGWDRRCKSIGLIDCVFDMHVVG